ncbi:Xenotropic and polytropic retrovirus receptor 1, variant 3 [Schistosoma haematobium]|uniref:Xenotropic and polytropic retrovirus receptor 1, variant 3 n=2 Tax=Schistosoma haematobium TaxID=6185 RepID=A0A6A5DA09_SCHHA|nr:Xenotropic and polytropic retrovirus receptor 1, variant 3 [Schistosoma haematobium]KAH9594410.1 Xenotropic and polytropic retrovirus receptor 1, variant 3 [Schistosoma haematobium]
MKFAERLNAHLTPEWRTQYIDYDELKEHLYKYTQVLETLPFFSEEETKAFLDECDEEFFNLCESALRKIEVFFSEKIAEANRKFTTLVDELDNYIESTHHKSISWITGSKVSLSRRLTESFGREGDKCRVSVRENGSTNTPIWNKISKIQSEENSELRRRQSRSKQSENPKYDAQRLDRRKKTFRKLHDLKLAFSEFYLSLVLLQNYQSLNFTGFRKILKKHDKLLRRNTGLLWRQQVVECAHFNTSRDVDDLITEVENIFTEKLEQGDRQKAMKRLRVPPLSEKYNPRGLFLFGLFFGVFLAQFIVILLTCIFLRPLPPHYLPALRLFRGTFLLIFFLCLFGVNTYGWRSSGVNNVLIFELDPRTHLDHFQLLQISFFFAMIWGCALIYFLFSEVLHSPGYASPLVLVSFMTLYLVNPFSFAHSKARRWLLRVLGRIIRAPFAKVSFADFWLADQLTSLSFIFPDIAYFICFYSSQIDWANGMSYKPQNSSSLTLPSLVMGHNSQYSNSTRLTIPSCASHSNEIIANSCQCEGILFGLDPILKVLPSWFRFAQCLRRYRDMDVKKANPHLLNAGKYSTAFLVSTCGVWLAFDRGTWPLVAYIISSIIRSGYTYAWDILMDWGLLDCRSEDKLLRDELVYRYRGYYFFAIIEDFVLRLTWIARLSFERIGFARMEIITTIFLTTEVIRRFIWNFFRLENEHLNNCGQFRAVRDIFITPLPKRPPRTSSLTTFGNSNSHSVFSSKLARPNVHSKYSGKPVGYSPDDGRRSVPDFTRDKSFNSPHKPSHFQASDSLRSRRTYDVKDTEHENYLTEIKTSMEDNDLFSQEEKQENPFHRFWRHMRSLGKSSSHSKHSNHQFDANYELSTNEIYDNPIENKPTFTLFIDDADDNNLPNTSNQMPASFNSREEHSSLEKSNEISPVKSNSNQPSASKSHPYIRERRVLILNHQTDNESGEPYEKCRLDPTQEIIKDYSSSPVKKLPPKSILTSGRKLGICDHQPVDQCTLNVDDNENKSNNPCDSVTNSNRNAFEQFLKMHDNLSSINELGHSNTSVSHINQGFVGSNQPDNELPNTLNNNNTVINDCQIIIRDPSHMGIVQHENELQYTIPVTLISNSESNQNLSITTRLMDGKHGI